jgi:FMN phosphatase YigB (HAD superfamily)
MIKTVFFDFDGVIARFKQSTFREYIIQKLGIFIPNYYDYYMGLEDNKELAKLIATDPDNFFKDVVIHHTDLIAEQLLEYGINAIILSNRPTRYEKFLNSLRGENDLPIICLGDMPKITFIQNYTEGLGINLNEVLLVEDNPYTDRWSAIGLNIAIVRDRVTKYYVDTYPKQIKYLIKHPINDLIETINRIEEDNK